MFFKQWKPIYEIISKKLNLSLEKEKESAKIFNKLLEKRKTYPIYKLKTIISKKDIFVFGAGSSLEKGIKKYKKQIKKSVKISADGATSALLKYNILPDIIVTDLDGKISDQIKANEKGSNVVIHCHGDNIDKIKKYSNKFKKKIIGTTQIDPKQYKNLNNFGGFTDGDRAIFLAAHFKAKNIFLIGFDFNGKIGKYSFSKNKDKKLKLKKLEICKNLIKELIKTIKITQLH